jgi:hypothetical protein
VGTGCKARDEAVEVALAVLAQLHGDRDGLAEQRLGLDVALRADEVEADLAELAEAAGRRHRLEQQVGWRQRRSELDRRRRHGESSTLRRSGRASDRSLPPLPRQATKVTRARVAAVHGQRPPASALSRSHGNDADELAQPARDLPRADELVNAGVGRLHLDPAAAAAVLLVIEDTVGDAFALEAEREPVGR